MRLTANPVVAIDGPSGAGKSTVARALAARLGVPYIDTGAMYRAVGLAARERGIPLPIPDPAAVEAHRGVGRHRPRPLAGGDARPSRRARRLPRDPASRDLALRLRRIGDPGRAPEAGRGAAAAGGGTGRGPRGPGHRHPGLPGDPPQVFSDGGPASVRAERRARELAGPGHPAAPRGSARGNGKARPGRRLPRPTPR